MTRVRQVQAEPLAGQKGIVSAQLSDQLTARQSGQPDYFRVADYTSKWKNQGWGHDPSRFANTPAIMQSLNHVLIEFDESFLILVLRYRNR